MGVMKQRSKSEAQEVDSDGSWAISYGDMITLLLAFFILFFSTDPQRDRLKLMEQSLIIKLDSTYKAKPDESASGNDRTPASEVIATDLMGPEQFKAKVYKVGERLIVEFPRTSFFGLGKVELTKEGERELGGFVQKYMPYAGNYILGIRAFTDNKKVIQNENRRFNDNLELSALRSVAAMRVLQKNGVPLNRMRLGGYGELNLTAEDLAQAVKTEPDYVTNGIALARKVVLVIEPEMKEDL